MAVSYVYNRLATGTTPGRISQGPVPGLSGYTGAKSRTRNYWPLAGGWAQLSSTV
jgi:hypothetical protein